MRNQHPSTGIKPVALAGLALGLIGTAAIGLAQTPTFPVPEGDPPHAAATLEELVGPIALYPDDLIGIVLPASTYPLQIVQARRYLEQKAADASLEPDETWDDSIIALLNYPEVLELLDANIDWTWALGEAVLAQQVDVLDAVQDFRARAYTAGNLRSDERQTVSEDDGVIEIAPANPEIIYIPYYEPERVVYVQPQPAFYYYPRPYPVYYYPYPYGFHFSYYFGGAGFFWGVTSIFDIGWHNHYLHVYHHRHHLHPYYDHTYYAPYYARRSVIVDHVWKPYEHRGARPHVGRGRVVTSREGYADRHTTTTVAGSRANTTGSSTPRFVREDTRAVERRNARRPERGVSVSSTNSSSTARLAAPNANERSARRVEPGASSQLGDRDSASVNTAVRAGPRTGNALHTLGSVAPRSATPAETRARATNPTRRSVPTRPATVASIAPESRAARPQISRQPTPFARSPAPQARTAITPARSVAPQRSVTQSVANQRSVRAAPAQRDVQSASRTPTFAAPRSSRGDAGGGGGLSGGRVRQMR